MEERIKLFNGDNMESLKKLPDNFVDSIVTDPPYGLSFMNKKWDYDVPSVEFWKEVLRVLKPGGHVLSFGGTRTYHRMVVNMEDAGFEIRDQIMWVYGSGFPKSHNIGKAVDKLEGNEREVTGWQKYHRNHNNSAMDEYKRPIDKERQNGFEQTKGSSIYEGWGTGLKPANEPICLARKPLSEKTIVENVLKWGTGGINIDGCRIGTDKIKSNGYYNQEDTGIMKMGISNKSKNDFNGEIHEGRFPANFIIECTCDEVIPGENKGKTPANYERTYNDDNPVRITNSVKSGEHYKDTGDIHTNPDCPCRLLDEQSGESKSTGGAPKNVGIYGGSSYNESKTMANFDKSGFGDTGGASRFFYVAKVSKKERNMGLDLFEDKETPTNKNNHPTVKPINLLTYLCRLITPKGGSILDPYMGSGSTGISALLEGFEFIGMEMDDEYFKIAEARINNYELYKTLIKK